MSNTTRKAQHRRLPLPLFIAGLLLPLVAAVTLGGCSDSEGDEAGSVRAVATLEIIAGFVEEIGGDRVQVDALLPSGADPHTYEPPPGNVARITGADIVFANGLGLEVSTLALIEANVSSGTPVVELGERAADAGVELIEGGDSDNDHAGDEDGHEDANPHVWLDPDAARVYADIIRSELAAIDPEGAAFFEANHESFVARLREAADYLRDTTAAVPEQHRVLVTTHDAFPYLARAIGFEIGGVVTVSPGQEPSPQTVANLSRQISETGLPAVFREPQLGPEAQVLEQAAADAGVHVCILYSDSLDSEVDSYTEIIRYNADELTRCLGDAR